MAEFIDREVLTKIIRVIDAMEVVKCKECRYCKVDTYTTSTGVIIAKLLKCNKMCQRCAKGSESSFDATVKPDDFCSHGEHMDAEEG